MLELKDVTFKYGDSDYGVYDINLSVKRGECILLCGHSGCGKTTVTRLVNGLAPSFFGGTLRGTISIDNEDITGLKQYEVARKVSSVFQNPKAQFFNTDTESELVFSLENRGVPVSEINIRLEEAVKKFGLGEILGRSPSKISGGQAQVVALAAAYIADTEIAVLDEPTANLDEKAIESIQKIVLAMKEKGKTIIISEHRISWLREIADKVIYMAKGKIVETYTGKEFYSLNDKECSELGLRSLKKAERIKSVYITELEKKYGDGELLKVDKLILRREKRKWAFDVNASFAAGRIYCITGENGKGKTTLLRTLAGLEKEAGGSIYYNGIKMKKRSRRKLVSMVFQKTDDQLFSDTVLGECMLGNGNVNEEKAFGILKTIDLSQYSSSHPQSLSGGQRQRLAVATAILSDKPILLFDEPTSGLDLGNMKLIAKILYNAAKDGKICIVVTHDNELINKIYESDQEKI